jgi:hypothetical protein
VSCFNQVAGYRGSHVSQTNKSYFHFSVPFPSSAQHQQPNSTADSVEQAAYQKAEGSRTKTDYDHL